MVTPPNEESWGFEWSVLVCSFFLKRAGKRVLNIVQIRRWLIVKRGDFVIHRGWERCGEVVGVEPYRERFIVSVRFAKDPYISRVLASSLEVVARGSTQEAVQR